MIDGIVCSPDNVLPRDIEIFLIKQHVDSLFLAATSMLF